MSTDVLSHFSCLDELTQVIYQGVDRFVVLSSVSDAWTIHLGLAGPEGRWWRGSWTEDDILRIIGSKASDKLLEAFAEKLAETIVQGGLYIAQWSAEKGAEIKLTVGPSSKKPLHIPLVEISAGEAAAYATGVFLEIALQAQSRKCRLHPGQYATSSVTVDPPRDLSVAVRGPGGPSSSNSAEQQAQDEIRALKTELDKQKIRMVSGGETIDRASATNKKGTVPRVMKGASLANPNKKARKYEAIEFESDEEM